MSQYINLDDPEVEYYLNFGHSEAYIVTPEAERIDLVRCGECKHLTNDRICPRWERICEITGGGKAENGYCDEGERRVDGEVHRQQKGEKMAEKSCLTCVWYVWVGNRYACCLGCCRDYERWEKRE